MKKVQTLFLATALLAGIVAAPAAVHAVDGGNYDTNGIVTFAPNTETTPPVDPLDPGNPSTPIDPTDPDGPNPGTAGPLSIDYASSLDFGQQKITSKNEVYYAKAQQYKDKDNADKTGPNYVQVTDNRGTEAGWNLQVKQNGQFKTADLEELNGAQVSFKNGNVVTASESPKPTGETEIVLDTMDALKPVMTAEEKQGAGTYLLNWGTDATTAANSIELSVPGASTKYAKEYKTTFTWVLADTPVNE